MGSRGTSTIAQSGSGSPPIRNAKFLKRQFASDVGVEEQQSGYARSWECCGKSTYFMVFRYADSLCIVHAG